MTFPLKDAIEIARAGTPRKDGKDYLTTDADHCKIHGKTMSGVVVVKPAGAD